MTTKHAGYQLAGRIRQADRAGRTDDASALRAELSRQRLARMDPKKRDALIAAARQLDYDE